MQPSKNLKIQSVLLPNAADLLDLLLGKRVEVCLGWLASYGYVQDQLELVMAGRTLCEVRNVLVNVSTYTVERADGGYCLGFTTHRTLPKDGHVFLVPLVTEA